MSVLISVIILTRFLLILRVSKERQPLRNCTFHAHRAAVPVPVGHAMKEIKIILKIINYCPLTTSRHVTAYHERTDERQTQRRCIHVRYILSTYYENLPLLYTLLGIRRYQTATTKKHEKTYQVHVVYTRGGNYVYSDYLILL